jgi:hypothetical protein
MGGAQIGSLAGTVIGAAVGTIIEPGAGTLIGASLGGLVGGLGGGLYDTLTAKDTRIEQQSIADQTIQTSTYGLAIPQVWGAYPISGNIIWAGSKVEVQHRSSQSGKGGGKKVVSITKTYTQSFAMCLCDTRITGPMDFVVQIWRDNTVIYDRAQTGPTLPTGWTFYPGSSTQTADPTIEAAEGAGNVPGYRYRAYVVVVNDDLGQAGQSHIYKVEVARAGDNVVAPFLVAVCGAAGVPSSQVDIAAIDTGIPLSMAIVNIEQARAPIEQVMGAYRLYCIESGTKLVFRRKGAGSVVATIPEDDIAAGEDTHTDGGLQIERLDTAGLPTDLDVSSIDKDLLYQSSVQRFILARAVGLAPNPRNISTSLALLPAQAKQLALESLNEAWTQRETMSTTLSRKYATLEPGDRITITGRAITYDLVVTETSYGHPGILELQATIDAAFVTDAAGDPPGSPDPWIPPLVDAASSTAVLLNLPALGANDTTPRYHVGYLPGAGQWDGATLYRSDDSEATYQQVSINTVEVVTGTVALATPVGVTHAFDNTTVITVIMQNSATLASVTDAALLAGQNLFSLGSEILSVGTVTLIAANTYELTHLYRGRRGTEHLQATHAINERLALLDLGAKAVDMAVTDASISRMFKPVTFGQNIADVTGVAFAPTAANMLPFTAWYVAAEKLTDGTWQVLWQYRPRFGGDWVDGFVEGFDVDHSGFEVTIYSSNTYVTVKRVIVTSGDTILDATSGKGVVYSAAEQVIDFGSTQATLYYKVAQVTAFGAGYAVNQVAS